MSGVVELFSLGMELASLRHPFLAENNSTTPLSCNWQLSRLLK